MATLLSTMQGQFWL